MATRNSERLKASKDAPQPWPNRPANKEMKSLWENYWPLIKVKPQGGTVDPIDVENCCDQMLGYCNAKKEKWGQLKDDPNRKEHKTYQSLFNFIRKKMEARLADPTDIEHDEKDPNSQDSSVIL